MLCSLSGAEREIIPQICSGKLGNSLKRFSGGEQGYRKEKKS